MVITVTNEPSGSSRMSSLGNLRFWNLRCTKHNPHLPRNLEKFSSFPNSQNNHTCILPPRPRWRLVDVVSTPLPPGLTSANKIKTCHAFWKSTKFGWCPNDTCFIHVHFDSSWFIFIQSMPIHYQTDDPVVWKRQNTVLQTHLQYPQRVARQLHWCYLCFCRGPA